MVVTREQNYRPWYIRWNLPTVGPSLLLAIVLIWSVSQSIEIANWADGLYILSDITLPALLIGTLFALLPWLPGWLAHILSAGLSITWTVYRIGPFLQEQVGQELNVNLGTRLATWYDQANEILIRLISWIRVLIVGGRGEDVILFVVALCLIGWILAYLTGWLLFRKQLVWLVVLMNAVTILVNYTFTMPKPDRLFFLFLGTALLLIAHQNVIKHQEIWRLNQVNFPDFISLHFLRAAAAFCAVVVLVSSLIPGSVSNQRVAQVWQFVSTPFTIMRERWETAFTTINAPAGSNSSDFSTGGSRVGGPRVLSNQEIMRVRSPRPEYWRALVFDRYTGFGWQGAIGERARSALGVATQIEALTPIDSGQPIPQFEPIGRVQVSQSIEMLQGRNDDLIVFGGDFESSGLANAIQHGYLINEAGQPLPNFSEIAAVYSQSSLQQPQTYTVTTYFSVIDQQSLREASTNYPLWVTDYYLQLPNNISDRTRELAQQIVSNADATNPFDQAIAIQNYLSQQAGYVYDEQRVAPPSNTEWADYFLFESKRGYCDDFTTAMIVMLRSLDIPARWAQGYATGSIDPESGSYVVRQNLAHSWPEVYFPGYGWQRFEPTPASYASPPVRPLQPANTNNLPPTPNIPFDPSMQSQAEIDRMNRIEDMLEESAIDLEKRQAELAQLQRAERMRKWTIAGIIIVMLGIGIGFFRNRLQREIKGLSAASAAYYRVGRLARYLGLGQEKHTTPYEYAQTLSQQFPEQAPQIQRITKAYVAERYQSNKRQPAREFESDWQAIRKGLLGYIGTYLRSILEKQTKRRR
jgi:transglutaminase-like putative cysteine protease